MAVLWVLVISRLKFSRYTANHYQLSVYIEYSMHHGATTHMRGYRTSRWKLVRDFANPGRGELYNLETDPRESTNLVESDSPLHVRIRKELDRKILKQMHALDDPALAEIIQ